MKSPVKSADWNPYKYI